MAITHITNEYAIPRGRVYFDPFDANGLSTGEIPLGNCPGFTFTAETEKAEHFSSETGLAEKDAALIVKVNRTGSLTCDNFSNDNLALFVSGSKETQSQSAGDVAAEAHTVSPGRIYQLGVSNDAPAGVRAITNVVVKSADGLTTYEAGVAYNTDLDLGRLQIIAGGPIAAATAVKVDYKTTLKSWQRVKSGATAEVSGSLRVIADNASGTNRDWFMPKVTLTPSGEIPVIQEGTDFTQMQFGVEVLKAPNREALYIDGRPAA
ncbi:MAG: hypothetical protein RBS27_01445 [Giesbergeria sp.]|jgi:hypothetical protein|nr:hypothetical protein [Giesbergeria sp.]